MKIKRQRLREYLASVGLTEREFFHGLDLDASVTLQLCFGGTRLDECSARKLVNTIGAEEAYNIIDWEAMNVKRPSRREIFANAY